jgi:hypothetical protein
MLLTVYCVVFGGVNSLPCKVLVGKPDWRRGKANNKSYFKAVGCEGVYWIQFAQHVATLMG